MDDLRARGDRLGETTKRLLTLEHHRPLPTTDAGCRYLASYATKERHAAILAIEAEARADALREAAERVRALQAGSVWNYRDAPTEVLTVAAVLAILDPAGEGKAAATPPPTPRRRKNDDR